MEAVPFDLGLGYEMLYLPFELLHCARVDFLTMFFPSILELEL